MESLDHMVTLYLTFWEVTKLFQRDCTILHFSQLLCEWRSVLILFTTSLLTIFLIIAIQCGERFVVSIENSLASSDIGHLFVCLFAIYISAFAHLTVELSFHYWVISILYILDASLLPDMICKYFLPICGWFFHFFLFKNLGCNSHLSPL